MNLKPVGLVLFAAAVFVTATYIFVSIEQSNSGLRGFESAELKRLKIISPPEDAPATAFVARDGSPWHFKSFKGEVVLVNFWATWCAPCRDEMPSLVNLANTMKGRDFRLITITLDRQGFEAADPFLEEVGAMGLETYQDRSNKLLLEAAGGELGLPLTLFLNRKGKVVAKMLGPAEWDGEAAQKLIETVMTD